MTNDAMIRDKIDERFRTVSGMSRMHVGHKQTHHDFHKRTSHVQNVGRAELHKHRMVGPRKQI